jgi:hypothetical protein
VKTVIKMPKTASSALREKYMKLAFELQEAIADLNEKIAGETNPKTLKVYRSIRRGLQTARRDYFEMAELF